MRIQSSLFKYFILRIILAHSFSLIIILDLILYMIYSSKYTQISLNVLCTRKMSNKAYLYQRCKPNTVVISLLAEKVAYRKI
jgi:hypothetical protein